MIRVEQRGSILVLVIVFIGVTTLLGAIYLSGAKSSRETTALAVGRAQLIQKASARADRILAAALRCINREISLVGNLPQGTEAPEINFADAACAEFFDPLLHEGAFRLPECMAEGPNREFRICTRDRGTQRVPKFLRFSAPTTNSDGELYTIVQDAVVGPAKLNAYSFLVTKSRRAEANFFTGQYTGMVGLFQDPTATTFPNLHVNLFGPLNFSVFASDALMRNESTGELDLLNFTVGQDVTFEDGMSKSSGPLTSDFTASFNTLTEQADRIEFQRAPVAAGPTSDARNVVVQIPSCGPGAIVGEDKILFNAMCGSVYQATDRNGISHAIVSTSTFPTGGSLSTPDHLSMGTVSPPFDFGGNVAAADFSNAQAHDLIPGEGISISSNYTIAYVDLAGGYVNTCNGAMGSDCAGVILTMNPNSSYTVQAFTNPMSGGGFGPKAYNVASIGSLKDWIQENSGITSGSLDLAPQSVAVQINKVGNSCYIDFLPLNGGWIPVSRTVPENASVRFYIPNIGGVRFVASPGRTYAALCDGYRNVQFLVDHQVYIGASLLQPANTDALQLTANASQGTEGSFSIFTQSGNIRTGTIGYVSNGGTMALDGNSLSMRCQTQQNCHGAVTVAIAASLIAPDGFVMPEWNGWGNGYGTNCSLTGAAVDYGKLEIDGLVVTKELPNNRCRYSTGSGEVWNGYSDVISTRPSGVASDVNLQFSVNAGDLIAEVVGIRDFTEDVGRARRWAVTPSKSLSVPSSNTTPQTSSFN